MITNGHLEQVKSIDNTLAITSTDLSSSPTASKNVALRNRLQESVGALKTTSNGYSTAQLRDQKCKRRKVDKNVALATMPFVETMSFDRRHPAVTPSSNIVSTIGRNNNSRWW